VYPEAIIVLMVGMPPRMTSPISSISAMPKALVRIAWMPYPLPERPDRGPLVRAAGPVADPMPAAVPDEGTTPAADDGPRALPVPAAAARDWAARVGAVTIRGREGRRRQGREGARGGAPQGPAGRRLPGDAEGQARGDPGRGAVHAGQPHHQPVGPR
jgi:hypothetical protein